MNCVNNNKIKLKTGSYECIIFERNSNKVVHSSQSCLFISALQIPNKKISDFV